MNYAYKKIMARQLRVCCECCVWCLISNEGFLGLENRLVPVSLSCINLQISYADYVMLGMHMIS
jgi:hypothetical protein